MGGTCCCLPKEFRKKSSLFLSPNKKTNTISSAASLDILAEARSVAEVKIEAIIAICKTDRISNLRWSIKVEDRGKRKAP